jgi:hypothetical protein
MLKQITVPKQESEIDCLALPTGRFSVGVSFTAKGKESGQRNTYFYVPHPVAASYRLYRWDKVGALVEVKPTKISERKAGELREFWDLPENLATRKEYGKRLAWGPYVPKAQRAPTLSQRSPVATPKLKPSEGGADV